MEKSIVKAMSEEKLKKIHCNLKETLKLSQIQNYFPILDTLDIDSNFSVFKSKYHINSLIDNLNNSQESEKHKSPYLMRIFRAKIDFQN